MKRLATILILGLSIRHPGRVRAAPSFGSSPAGAALRRPGRCAARLPQPGRLRPAGARPGIPPDARPQGLGLRRRPHLEFRQEPARSVPGLHGRQPGRELGHPAIPLRELVLVAGPAAPIFVRPDGQHDHADHGRDRFPPARLHSPGPPGGERHQGPRNPASPGRGPEGPGRHQPDAQPVRPDLAAQRPLSDAGRRRAGQGRIHDERAPDHRRFRGDRHLLHHEQPDALGHGRPERQLVAHRRRPSAARPRRCRPRSARSRSP